MTKVANNFQFLLVLVAAGAILTGTIAWVYNITHTRIKANHEAHALRTIREVLPEGAYDNEPHRNGALFTNVEWLGSDEPQPVYVARSGDQPVAAAITVTSPAAYVAPIKLLVGIDPAGLVIDVRVIHHQETPGLGDNIEIAKSDWITAFRNESLQNRSQESWSARRSGGDFDQMSGATVTSNAVIEAVYRALRFEFENRAEIYQQHQTTAK
jgi:electron transport complex protein RnfG